MFVPSFVTVLDVCMLLDKGVLTGNWHMLLLLLLLLLFVCVCACVRACERACVRARVCACVRT